jgi:hypothetical protein
MSKQHAQLAAALNGQLYHDPDAPLAPTPRELDERRRREGRQREITLPANAHQTLFEALGGEPVVDDDSGRHTQLARALGLTR